MKTIIVVYATYVDEDNEPKCDILTVTESMDWADHTVNVAKTEAYDNVFKETHYIE